MVHKWISGLLQYQFVIYYRTARTMWEFNILSRYNKATELWRYNNAENASTERSLSEHTALTTSMKDNQTVVLFKKKILVAEKPILVENLP